MSMDEHLFQGIRKMASEIKAGDRIVLADGTTALVVASGRIAVADDRASERSVTGKQGILLTRVDALCAYPRTTRSSSFDLTKNARPW